MGCPKRGRVTETKTSTTAALPPWAAGSVETYDYTEEALAEGYATRSALKGLAFPVTNGM